MVVNIAGIEGSAYFVCWNPVPSEFDIGATAFAGDAGDGDHFAPRDGDAEGFFLGVPGSNQILHGGYAQGGEGNVPARRRGYGLGAGGEGGEDPALMLQPEIVGGKIILVRDWAGMQLKLPLDLKSFRARDQIGGEAAGQKVTGRTGREQHACDTQNGNG